MFFLNLGVKGQNREVKPLTHPVLHRQARLVDQPIRRVDFDVCGVGCINQQAQRLQNDKKRAEQEGSPNPTLLLSFPSLSHRPLPLRRRFPLAPVSRPPHDLPLGLRGRQEESRTGKFPKPNSACIDAAVKWWSYVPGPVGSLPLTSSQGHPPSSQSPGIGALLSSLHCSSSRAARRPMLES